MALQMNTQTYSRFHISTLRFWALTTFKQLTMMALGISLTTISLLVTSDIPLYLLLLDH
jgi:hypothetical protein